MRRRLAALPRPVQAGLLLFAMSFALYAVTTQTLTGYEPETGAVTEGLVRDGVFYDKEDSLLPLKADISGEDGRYYARTGLLQPLLEAPFMAAGLAADNLFGHFSHFQNAYTFLWFYNPFVAALAVVAMFALIYLTRRSLRWATTIAVLFAVASIAWPYSKIGMETTFMFTIIAAFAVGAWARQSPTALSWSLTGFATGAAVATKAYAVISVLPILILLLPTFLKLDRARQVRLGLAACLPLLLWAVAIGVYNHARFGSPTDFGYPPSPWAMAAPFNFLGLILSPGKGLLFYSPLIALGALGLPRLWREDRSLTLALLSFFVVLTSLSGLSAYWGDEVWGPRYIVPAAWVLLVPIAWWATTVTRQKVMLAVAAVAVVVQIVGISAQYSRYTDVVRKLSGVPVYHDRIGVDPERIPYGNDPTRWIPELSALLLQTEALLSSQVVEPLTGDGLEVTYAPFEGRSRKVDFSEPLYKVPLDFWWSWAPAHKALARGLAVLVFLIAVAAAAGLYRVTFGRGPPWRERTAHA
jgi:hypothetical protein